MPRAVKSAGHFCLPKSRTRQKINPAKMDVVKKWRQGERHPVTGKIFWAYQVKPYGTYESWLTDEKFAAYVEKRKAAWRRRPKTNYTEKRAYDNAWREKNRAKVNAMARIRHAKQRREQPEKVAEWKRSAYRREQENPMCRLKKSLRARLAVAIKRNRGKRARETKAILGCSLSFVRAYLEARFKPGMTWENYGTAWHVDHATPLASAKSMNDVYRLCHYTNLQPLWAPENLAKRDRVARQTELGL